MVTVETESYRGFKARYLIPSLEDKESYKENNKEKKERLVLLIGELVISVAECVKYNITKDYSLFNSRNQHRKTRHDRATTFSQAMNNLSEEVVDVLIDQDNTIQSSDFEIKLIKELISFAGDTGKYVNHSGDINVNEHSCLSYIIRALNSIYIRPGNGIQSKILN